MGTSDEVVDVTSPVAGTVASVEHAVGWRVRADDVVATVQAADGATTVHAGVAGIVGEVHVQPGAPIALGAVVMVVEANRLAPTIPPPHVPGLDPQPGDGSGDEPEAPPGRCTYCGWAQLEEGFIREDARQYGEWLRGPLRFGSFGGVRYPKGRACVIGASRCARCSHLELFALDRLRR
jgi:hypothetical protein